MIRHFPTFHCLLFLWLLLVPTMAAAQERTIETTRLCHFSTAISYEEGKARAVEEAIAMALADEFGTTVNEQSWRTLTEEGGSFTQFARLQVKGRLVRHLKEPEVMYKGVEMGMVSVEVALRFRAAPITYAPIQFKTLLLRNGTEDRFADTRFRAGDAFHMAFESPREGYLAVFFEDRETVTCMLPYLYEDEAPLHVKKQERYVLFTKDPDTFSMTCGEEPEVNFVHVVFSPKPFIRGDLVREMPCLDFRKWIGRLQSFDEELQLETQLINISPQ